MNKLWRNVAKLLKIYWTTVLKLLEIFQELFLKKKSGEMMVKGPLTS